VSGTARRVAPTAGTAFLVLIAVSTAFPVVASLIPGDEVPATMGIVDVALAGVVAVLGFWIDSRSIQSVTDRHRSTAWRIIRILATTLLLLMVVYFIRPDIVHWDVLLLGLAWRAWLFIWVLPAVLATVRPGPDATLAQS
jgi:hypothetical protein